MTRWVLVALAALLLVPMGQAQINRPMPLQASFGFDDPDEDGALTFVSGRMEADLVATGEAWGFFDVEGLAIEGITRYCPDLGLRADCVAGDFRLVVEDGGSVGIHLPTAEGKLEAEHALAFFMRARGDDLQGMELNESLVAPLVDGRMSFSKASAPRIPLLNDSQQCLTLLAKVAALNADTTIRVYEGTKPIGTVTRADSAVCFAGASMAIEPFSAWAVAVPFEDPSTVEFSVASRAAAREGIELQRITRVQELIQDASKEQREARAEEVKDNALLDSLSEVLNAAIVRLPTDPDNTTVHEVRQQLAIILYDSVSVDNRQGQLAWQGTAAMQYREGHLKGAQELYGFWFFQLPWWGWLLWIAAIAVFATRLGVNPYKDHERWDRFRWIGWVAGAVVFAIVFFLWDLEMRSVWGTSVLTTNNAGTAFWITFAIQLGTMSLVLGAVAWPLSIIIKNGLLLARQGTFMGLGKPLSLLLAYVIGATLFLAYMELLIQRVVESLPGA